MSRRMLAPGFAGMIALGLSATSMPAHAQMGDDAAPFDGPYAGVGLGINNFDYEVDGQNVEDTGFAYEALVGYRQTMNNGLLAGVEAHIAGSEAKDAVSVDIGGGETYTGTTSLGRSLGFDGIFGKTFGRDNRFLGFVSAGYLNQQYAACCVVGDPVDGVLPVNTVSERESGYRVGGGVEAKLYRNLAWRATVHYSDTGRVDQTQLMTGVTAGF